MVTLRDVTSSDAKQILHWRNLPDVRRYMYTSHVISPEEHERWFARISTDRSRRYWIIQWDGNDVGLGTLSDINAHHGRCEYSSYLADGNTRGKGVGTAAEFRILEYAFGELGVRKVCCGVLSFNTAGADVHKRLGFVEEGRLRQHILSDGKPVDVVLLGLLREEWETRKSSVAQRLKDRGLL